MGADALLAHVLDAFLFDQAAQCVKGSPRLEGADALLVLAFEEELNAWLRPVQARIASDPEFVRHRLGRRVFARAGTSLGLRR